MVIKHSPFSDFRKKSGSAKKLRSITEPKNTTIIGFVFSRISFTPPSETLRFTMIYPLGWWWQSTHHFLWTILGIFVVHCIPYIPFTQIGWSNWTKACDPALGISWYLLKPSKKRWFWDYRWSQPLKSLILRRQFRSSASSPSATVAA